MAERESEYKPLLFTTTVRNPERVKSLLYVFEKYDGLILTSDLATEIVGETIKYGLYRPLKKTPSIGAKWKTTPKGTFAEEFLSNEEVAYMIANNPQQHKEAGFEYGFPSRFATIYDFTKELGFVYFAINQKIEFSDLGHKLANVYEVNVTNNIINVELIHPEYEQQAFLQAMAKYQRHNPFVSVLNDNIPLILLLQTIKRLNANPKFNTNKGESKGISRIELPLLIFWKNNDAEALYKRIVKLRNEYGYEPSDEAICDICTEEIMGGFKKFKPKSIIEEYPDEFIRKMRITGLISLRGAGRFVDINHNEEAKIDYIIKNYSHYQIYTDEKEYFNYMAEIDENLFSQQAKKITSSQSETLLTNWISEYSWNKIKHELKCLSSRTNSKDTVLKLLPAPARLEFLTALSIKVKLPNVRVIPNYSCDDTGLPTSTAGGNMGDIECYEDRYGILVEVTMAEGRTQTMMEIWPIERHLTDFKEKNEIESQAIFIAPTIFSDSNRQITFVKDTNNLLIRPYKIDDFIQYLETRSTLYLSEVKN
jgi:hypothetical protein